MMVTRFETMPIHARLRLAVDLLLAGEQREFPVVDNARPGGRPAHPGEPHQRTG